jgi:hypothetical protein
MKAQYMNIDWLIPLLGTALVAGVVLAARIYLDIERKTQSAEAFTGTLDHLYQDQVLSAALKILHDGDAAAAAQRLDLLLCDNILRLNSEVAFADDRKAAYVQSAFLRIARLRPKHPDTTDGVARELDSDQLKAEKILRQVCAENTRAN